jgi:iron complex transport system substrate-binding protein
LYADLHNLGIIFDVQEKAEAEIASIKAKVAQLQASVKANPNVKVWTYSGEESPFPAGNAGMSEAIIEMAGVSNAFGDINKGYDQVSWEQVVKRNPDIIWLQTSAGPGFLQEAGKILDKLAADPRLANVTAVKNRAYVVVSYNEGPCESPRNVDALEKMIAGLSKVSS